MTIPKQFKLQGKIITVEYQEDLYHEEGVHAWAKYRTDKIILQPSTEQTPITQNTLEQNFYHELIHHILYVAGEDTFDPPLHRREYLVDRIAGLLHQALTTMQGAHKEDPK